MSHLPLPPAPKRDQEQHISTWNLGITGKLFFWNPATLLMNGLRAVPGSNSFILFHAKLKNKSQQNIFGNMYLMVQWKVCGLEEDEETFHVKARNKKSSYR